MEEKRKVPKIRFKGFTDDWEQRKFENIFDYERPDKYIVKSDEYNDYSKTPVLTANKAFILGYTDESNTYNKEKESILFDDFTLDTKFVDFPYMVKSSALKILTVKDKKNDNLRFNYELLSKTKFNMLGHARHYISVVQPEEIRTTNKEEQDKIAKLTTTIDNLITLHQRKYEKLVNMKKSMLEKMFPKNSSKKPEIRFKGFTDDWEQRKVEELFKITRGYVLSATLTSESKDNKNKYPVYSSQTQNNGLMGYYNDYLYDTAITWTTDGANAGTVRFRPGKFYCTNVCGVLLSDKGYANKMMGEALNNIAKKYVSYVGNPKLMNNVMAEIPLNYPNNLNEQNQISNLFQNIDNLITLHQRKYEKLVNMKKSMLEKMFV